MDKHPLCEECVKPFKQALPPCEPRIYCSYKCYLKAVAGGAATSRARRGVAA